MTGITHTILAGRRLKIKSGVGISYTKMGFNQDYTEDDSVAYK